MKKLFTLVAFMACFLGAKAEWVTDYSVDYSTYKGFPFYVMGYVPEWMDGIMTDFGSTYRYETQANLDGDGDGKLKDNESIVGSTTTNSGAEYQKVTGANPYWHQYFIADGIPTEIDGSYTVKALVKASVACTINVNMGWGWGSGQQTGASVDIPASDDFTEVEWTYTGIGGTSCNLVAQPGTVEATIEWKSLTVSHNQKETRPTVWQEWLTKDGQPVVVETTPKDIPTWMGGAEFGQWPDWSLETTDGININWRGDRTGEICAWALTMGKNFQESVINSDSPRARPYPADIEADATDETGKNHVFAVHAEQVAPVDETDAGSVAWANQFWIQSPQGWKEGTQIKLHFRYRADHACNAGTQIHKQHPSDYLHWQAVGDVSFTTDWQDFDKIFAFDGSQATGWSLAFNLNSDENNGRTPNVFYFDDLSWETMVLDEGYFVAGANTKDGIEYDLDNAIPFEYSESDGCYVATVGEADAWVNQIMISTVRGNDAAFKSNTLKPAGSIKNDPDEWLDYTESSLAKLNLPGSGIWKVYLDDAYKAMAFQMIDGVIDEPLVITPNPTEVIVHGQERDYTSGEQEGGTGQAWDNQFFIKAERALVKGESTILKFKYMASKDAKTTTQCHKDPGAYLHWGAIGDVNFTTDWQDFEQTFKVPNEADGMQSIAFNMAEIKEACDYHIKDVIWQLEDGSETLINMTDGRNFWIKEGAGTDPYQLEVPEPAGINSVVNNKTNAAAIYNLAGQRVSKDYKGLVIQNGKKYVAK